MIDPEAGVLLPVLAKVIPEGVDLLVRETRPHRICPALRKQPLVTFAAFRLQQCVCKPGARVVDVKVSGLWVAETPSLN